MYEHFETDDTFFLKKKNVSQCVLFSSIQLDLFIKNKKKKTYREIDMLFVVKSFLFHEICFHVYKSSILVGFSK